VDYKQKGHKAEFVSHDSVEGTDCYKIKLTLKTGDIQIYYLDADSFLELKLERQTTIRGAVKENETYYGDYEEINGMYFPFAVETAEKGDPDRTKITVEKVELNVSLEDILFSMPTARPETKAAVAPKMNIAFRLFARTDLRLLVRTTNLTVRDSWR
jgi:Outer membrane lipoprotein-sorting protein